MTSGLIGAPETTYHLVINSPVGDFLRIVKNYSELSATRTVNALGTLTFTVPMDSYAPTDLPIDGLVELWRTPLAGAPVLFLEALWFIREVYQDLRGGQRVWRIVCYDLLYLLGDPDNQRGRIIAYNAGNTTYTDLLLEADDMMKTIIRQNLGADALDTTRDLSAYLSVAEDVSLGAIMRKSDLSRRLILPVLQEIAAASAAAGTYLAFDIVCLTPPSQGAFAIQFRTYTGQRGQDHRAGSGAEVLVGPDFGNFDDAELGRSHAAEANYIYARGQGIGDVAAVLPASDDARIDISPFNRREMLWDASSTLDLVSLQDEADGALRAGRPRRTMDGRIIDSDQARFGAEWSWGDYLTAQFVGENFNCRVESVAASKTLAGGEDLQGRLRYDDIA